ncbi:MAG: hypothetical protein DRR11_13940 [Gammaproteobacteria bacterium]|nr:MAG: hypothetical protein DRR11_13940 [Gammaproteobacteria bacterium]RLA31621.1 MAG: hypothetical protein DRR15_12980 [Gammaproteobacteria bacterium]
MTENDEQQDEKMNCGLSVAEREILQVSLGGLEDTMPPRTVWQRIEEQARAEGLFKPKSTERRTWFLGVGMAAAVVLAVLNVPVTSVIDDGEQSFPTVPSNEVLAGNSGGPGLNALMVQSQQIERNLRALPGQPSLVRASTAATISDLEDHIAAIDYMLNHPEAQLSPEQVEIYWRERVRLMNSLLSLRTAQAQRTSF